jgi:hypothetical protein
MHMIYSSLDNITNIITDTTVYFYSILDWLNLGLVCFNLMLKFQLPCGRLYFIAQTRKHTSHKVKVAKCLSKQGHHVLVCQTSDCSKRLFLNSCFVHAFYHSQHNTI